MTIKASDILGITESVTKEWTKQRKAEERGARSRRSREYIYSDRVNFTDVAAKILPGAYEHASGGGKYTAAKRQIYYACRDKFREMTGRPLEADYFSNTLLVQYMNRTPATSSWKVTADPRGALTIPNVGHEVRVPCGTLQIDAHLRTAFQDVSTFDYDAELKTNWPSLAPGQRYQAVLYIEKEGFEPQLAEARIAERYDLAILSCKGQSVVAARKFVDQVCRVDGGVPLLVVHDFDKAGFEISQRLTTVSDWAEENDRVTYRFRNKINAIDLGLRLSDVEHYDLGSEYVEFKGRFARDSICTADEREYLRGNQRVELNAFTSPQFIEWIESKLAEAGIVKRLIPSDDVLENAYRRALAVAAINIAIEEVQDDAKQAASDATVPADLRDQLEAAMATDDAEAWDKVLYGIARGNVEEGEH